MSGSRFSDAERAAQTRAKEEAVADALIRGFFERWQAEIDPDAVGQFHLDFVRVVQQITLEAARPYHALVRNALELSSQLGMRSPFPPALAPAKTFPDFVTGDNDRRNKK